MHTKILKTIKSTLDYSMEIQNNEKIIEAIQHISLKQVHLNPIL